MRPTTEPIMPPGATAAAGKSRCSQNPAIAAATIAAQERRKIRPFPTDGTMPKAAVGGKPPSGRARASATRRSPIGPPRPDLFRGACRPSVLYAVTKPGGISG